MRYETTTDWRERDSIVLADLYDADRHLIATGVASGRLSPTYGWTSAWVNRQTYPRTIPHPLIGVQYADGLIPDTTAGRIHTRSL